MSRRAETGRELARRFWEEQRAGLAAEIQQRPTPPAGMPPLRPSLRTPTGCVVNTDGPLWQLDRDQSGRTKTTLNVDRLYRPWDLGFRLSGAQLAGIPRRESVFSNALIHTSILFLARSIEKFTGGQAEAVLKELVDFESFLAEHPELRSAQVVDAKNITVEQYRAFVRTGQSRGILSRFYRWCVGRSFHGFSRKEELRLSAIPIPRTPRGAAIRSHDPERGALNWHEQQVLFRALRAPTADTVPLHRLIVWLFFELGARPTAVAALRGKSIRPTPLRDEYVVDVPKVKQGKPTRETVERKISRELGELAVSLAPANADEYLIGPNTVQGWGASACRSFVTANDIRTPRILERSEDQEPQPGRLPLNPYRLRYTMATSLAEQGASPEQIAAMLDDRTLAMALIYTSNTSELVDILEETLDQHPAWLHHVGLFLGKIERPVNRTLPEIQGGVPYLQNYDNWSERISTIGWCGSAQACQLQPPLSCYSCALFIADPDPGTHILQLEQLKNEIRSQIGVESDRMAKVFRPDLFAIAEVIALTRGGKTDQQRVEAEIARAGGALT